MIDPETRTTLQPGYEICQDLLETRSRLEAEGHCVVSQSILSVQEVDGDSAACRLSRVERDGTYNTNPETERQHDVPLHLLDGIEPSDLFSGAIIYMTHVIPKNISAILRVVDLLKPRTLSPQARAAAVKAADKFFED